MPFIKNYISILFCCLSTILLAQSELLEARTAYQNKDLKTAKSKIDIAQQNKLNKDRYDFWEAKGIIYYDVYKSNKPADSTFLIRKEALEALYKGYQLASDDDTKHRLIKKAKSAINSCYNSAIKQAESGEIKNSELGIELFLKYIELITPTTNTSPLLLQYSNVKAIYFEKVYKSGNPSAFEKAKLAYEEGLKLAPNNFEGNFHIALLYYNKSVDLIDQLDFIDIEAMRIKEEEAVELHKKALPYALKAFETQPENKVVIEMLEGIYFNTRDFEKADEFKALLEK